MIRRSFYKHDVHCAADGCDVPVGRGRIYCKGHYYSLSDALRSRLWDAWRAAMDAQRGHTPMDKQAQANRAYHEAFLACQQQLSRDPLPAHAAAPIDGGPHQAMEARL
jgi:hypothetical protein